MQAKYKIVLMNAFKRDLKSLVKQGKDISLLDDPIDTLAAGKTLDKKYKDHKLTGNWSGFREFHMESDWVVVYRIDEDEVVLVLVRTGSHDNAL